MKNLLFLEDLYISRFVFSVNDVHVDLVNVADDVCTKLHLTQITDLLYSASLNITHVIYIHEISVVFEEISDGDDVYQIEIAGDVDISVTCAACVIS